LNIERPTSNVEWKKMKKQKLSDRNSHRIYENKLNCGAERHHYSMFDPPEADSMLDLPAMP